MIGLDAPIVSVNVLLGDEPERLEAIMVTL